MQLEVLENRTEQYEWTCFSQLENIRKIKTYRSKKYQMSAHRYLPECIRTASCD